MSMSSACIMSPIRDDGITDATVVIEVDGCGVCACLIGSYNDDTIGAAVWCGTSSCFTVSDGGCEYEAPVISSSSLSDSYFCNKYIHGLMHTAIWQTVIPIKRHLPFVCRFAVAAVQYVGHT